MRLKNYFFTTTIILYLYFFSIPLETNFNCDFVQNQIECIAWAFLIEIN